MDLGGGYRKRPAKMSWSMPCRLQRWWTNLLLKLLWSQQLWGHKQLEHRVLLVLQKKHPPAKRARCLDLAIDEDEEAQLVPASGEGSGNALARV